MLASSSANMAPDASEQDDMRQGFLCPVCFRDLGDAAGLRQHFDRDHPAETDLAVQLKGLFAKAKVRMTLPQSDWHMRGLMRSGSAGNEPTDGRRSPSQQQQKRGGVEQPLGECTDWTEVFQKDRDTCIDQVAVQTNQLIIRLDKLVNHCPAELSKRKEFEREAVPWQNDSTCPSCRVCSEPFNLLRRRHHCRLCGTLMCKQCSVFITFLMARKLVNPAVAAGYSSEVGRFGAPESGDPDNGVSPRRRAERLLTAAAGAVLKRDTSEISVASFFNQEGESHLRVCPRCKQLLSRRDAVIEARQSPPIIVQLYDRLRQFIDQLATTYPTYCRMAHSLGLGESMYTLQDAQQLRLKIMNLQEQIDVLSKKIETFGATESGGNGGNFKAEISPRRQLLQRNVRTYATNILKETIFHVPTLPDEQQYVGLQKMYKEQIRRQIEDERSESLARASAAAGAGEQLRPNSLSKPGIDVKSAYSGHGTSVTGTGAAVSSSGGWSADYGSMPAVFHYNPFDEQDEAQIDPVQQQILIIKSTLRQAAEAGRLDDVHILEANLRELEAALKERSLDTPRTPGPQQSQLASDA